jgi:heme A synthase
VAVTGALAALGDTLYPASSVAGGLRAEFSSSAVGLLRVRVFHPAVALTGAVVLLFAAMRAARIGRPPAVHLGAAVATLVLVELAAGAVNIALLAPLWMQILHLLIADLLWIALVLMTLEAGRVPNGVRLNIVNQRQS